MQPGQLEPADSGAFSHLLNYGLRARFCRGILLAILIGSIGTAPTPASSSVFPPPRSSFPKGKRPGILAPPEVQICLYSGFQITSTLYGVHSMPKSLVKEALGKDADELEQKSSPQPAAQVQASPPAPPTADDEEIAKIAAQLDVSIKIIGCGGGGSNTINRCVEAGVSGAQLCAINTDAKHLLAIHAPKKILVGKNITRGLGAGAIPQVGEAAAKENEREIRDFLNGGNIVFVTAGMGGGTGTGSAHYAARLAKEQKALTIGVVTMPFKAEGEVRMENAMDGLERLRRLCDTTIVIPNDKLLELVPKLPADAAFKVADEGLMQTIP